MKCTVRFADLSPMHDEIREKLDAAYTRVLGKNVFINGEEVRLFEIEFATYCGVKHCIGVDNGLDALTLILKAVNIGSGDEVIVPSNTFIATALAVSETGAIPVFVEPDINTFNIDPLKIEQKISSKTKAIIAVHLQGRCADMDSINLIAKKYNLMVFEDSAQAHGSLYKGKKAGSLALAAGFSFYPGKNLGCFGDGGCVTTNDDEIAKKVRMLANYGSIRKYEHLIKGTNARLDELQCAFLRCKLPCLDRWNEYRRQVAKKYFDGITNPIISLPQKSCVDYSHIYHVFAIRCAKRDELENYLKENGIETVKHYPVPMHLQGAYLDLGIKLGDLPIAEEISKTILSIPIYYGMSNEQIDWVIETINNFK